MTITYQGRIYVAMTEQELALLFYAQLRPMTPIVSWAVAA